MIFLMNIRFSFCGVGFWLSGGDSLPVNAMKTKSRLLQPDDGQVTIRQTLPRAAAGDGFPRFAASVAKAVYRQGH
jgi:hypothetical protein